MGSKSQFGRYVGIDYSGAQTPTSSLSGLRIYIAEPESRAREVQPPPSPRKYWTRKEIAEWLLCELSKTSRTLVGIDHAFSFPQQYFQRYDLPPKWEFFLEDFQRHWPTDGDHIHVDFVRDEICGAGALRCGDRRWRRITENRSRTAKSVFHFDVQGSVAKSTHAGIPWLLHLRRNLGSMVHFWPFDGWKLPENRSVIAEVYPALWNRSFPVEDRNPHQQDAFVVAEWMRRSDADGTLAAFFDLQLAETERKVAEFEGWILGVT